MNVFTKKSTFYIFLVSILNSSVCGSNILFFHLVASASHRIAIWPLAEKLADSGHNVTYIFPMSTRVGSHAKIEEIKPSKLVSLNDAISAEVDIKMRFNNTMEIWLAEIYFRMSEICEAFYDSPEIQEWLASPKLHYDLILMDAGFGHCAYGLVHKFGAKHILFSPTTLGYMWDPFGLVPESSSVPEFTFHRNPATMATSLWSRTLGTIAPLLIRSIFLYNVRQVQAISGKKLKVLDTIPSFEEMEQDTSLVLYNGYFIEEYPVALPPMFVSYSGQSCKRSEIHKTSALSKSLTEFIEKGESDGFVYVSFGSFADMSTIPDALINEFFQAFAAFPNLKFLWKWTKSVESAKLPENLYVQKWFPQLDILAYPKIKAFVTQAGRSSTQEGICSGVPMIAIPVIADQDFNADRLEHIGAAIALNFDSLTKEKLIDALRKVVEGDSYKVRMKELSAMFRDRPIDPLENAHYWVEYVLKYNTSLLKPLGMNQTWWQRRLLGVYLLILLIILSILGLLMLLGLWTFRLIRPVVTYFIRNVALKARKEKKN